MKDFFKKVPLPIAGLVLSLAASGNLLQSHGEVFRTISGLLSLFCLVLITGKLVLYFSSIKEELQNPAIASVFTTLPMGIMLLTVYAKLFLGQVSFYIWILALLFNIYWVLQFTAKFVLNLEWKKVFASYSIVYSGFVVASVTAPAYGMQALGNVLFWFGFVGFLFVLGIGTYRYVKFPEVPEPAKPLIATATAPLSLCIAGYMSSVEPKSLPFLIFMLCLAHLLYVYSLCKSIKLLKLPFYPSYAAYTFPFVITAIASKLSNAYFVKQGIAVPWFGTVVLLETLIATLFVAYVFVRYMMHIFGTKK